MSNTDITDDLIENIDNSIRLQDDFFAFINGKWLEKTILPDDKSRWGNFDILVEKSIHDVKSILESDDFSDEDFKKVKIFYNAGMDVQKRNEQDFKPLTKILTKIESMKNKKDLLDTLNFLAREGVSSAFHVSSQIDGKDSSREVLHLYSSGLSLPSPGFTNKEYYLSPEKEEIRNKYVDHIATLFSFTGDKKALEKAKKVLEFETILAEKHFDQVQKRDPELTYNATNLSSLQESYINFNWENHFKAYTAITIEKIVLDNPDFFLFVNSLITDEKVEDWKVYLTARVLNTSASFLSERFVEEDFNFYGKIISGQKRLQDMYKQVLSMINNRYVLGELVGKYYVQKYFPQESKDKMNDLVANLLEVMGDRIQALDWMSDETKKKALNKLKHFKVKIGYPDKWEDYSGLILDENDSYVEIVTKCVNYIQKIFFENLYKAPNPHKWGMSPQTINAYYNQFRNEIVFPAGILQFPFFDTKLTDAENFGAIGVVIGHEITHGFDDKGSQFDFDGNLKNWWTETDKKLFTDKGNYIVEQYEQFLVNGKPLNGKLTLGENIADHGGVKIAYQALMNHYSKTGKREDADALSSEEKFFYSYGRVWRAKQRPEIEEQLRTTDPHAHPKARVNVTLANISEFQELFNVKEGDELFRKEIPKIW